MLRSTLFSVLAGALLLASPRAAEASIPFWDLTGFRGTVIVSTFAGCAEFGVCVEGAVATGQRPGPADYFARLLAYSGSLIQPDTPEEGVYEDLGFASFEFVFNSRSIYLYPHYLGEWDWSGPEDVPLGVPDWISADVRYSIRGDITTSGNVFPPVTSVTAIGITVTPEPATLALLLPGVAGVLWARRRRPGTRDA